jgi:predicted TIM-barrel fold metal-dependent hydrolase
VRSMFERAVDTHAHIFPPAFPVPDGPGLKPAPYEQVTREDYLAILRDHGVTQGVLVQPSGYGRDNSAMLDAMAHAGPLLRGIAMVAYDATDAHLDELERRGVVGHRFNLYDLDPNELREPAAIRLLERLRERGWYAEIHLDAPRLPAIAPILEKHAGKLLFCHMGRPAIERGVAEPGFARFLEFGRTGQAVVKLTGAIRFSKRAFPFEDVDPYLAAIFDAYGTSGCIWGSDWPFIALQQRITYDQAVAWFERAVSDDRDRRTILWENPQRLFGFSTQGGSR